MKEDQMGELEKPVKISGKGQITLPKRVREILATDVVKIVVEQGVVRIEPVKDVAGSLREYAKRYVTMKEAGGKAWEEAMREKHRRD
jgi:bifunctional DNA-binding transcriptional regulator/antitoxin component of YhaV-PrlF toxin-antitoxin module